MRGKARWLWWGSGGGRGGVGGKQLGHKTRRATASHTFTCCSPSTGTCRSMLHVVTTWHSMFSNRETKKKVLLGAAQATEHRVPQWWICIFVCKRKLAHLWIIADLHADWRRQASWIAEKRNLHFKRKKLWKSFIKRCPPPYQMQGHDKTAYVWGLRYGWDPSLSMSPACRLAHFIPPCLLLRSCSLVRHLQILAPLSFRKCYQMLTIVRPKIGSSMGKAMDMAVR